MKVLKYYEKIVFSFLSACFLVSVFVSSCHASASGVVNYEYFPIEQNVNGHFSDETLSLINSYFDSENYNIICRYQDYNYWLLRFPKDSEGMLYAEIWSNLYQTSIYSQGNPSINSYQFQVMYGSIVNVQNFGNNVYYFYQKNSPMYDVSTDYVSNFQLYTDSSKTVVVLQYGSGEEEVPEGDPFATGHASEPETPINPIDNDWTPRPVKPSAPTIINHIWPQAPSIDTTSIETLLESIFDILSWFAQNVSDEFNAVISNMVSIGTYIGDLLSYFGISIIDSISNLGKFLYDNFLGLFQAFFGSFLNFFKIMHNIYEMGLNEDNEFSITSFGIYLFVPPAEDVLDLVEENDEYGFLDITEALVLLVSGIGNHIHNVTPTDYIIIPSFTMFGQTIPQTIIDFSWYRDFKTVGDAIISAFMIIGYIYWLWTRLPGYLRGNSGDIFTDNQSSSSDYHGTKIGF